MRPARLSARPRCWVVPSADDAPLTVALAWPRGAVDRVHGQVLTASIGAGPTAAAAIRRASDEYAERRAGFVQGDEPCHVAPFTEVAAHAVPPNAMLCLSARQLGVARTRRAPAVLGLDVHQPIAWTPACSLVTGAERWLPARLVYFGYPARAAGTRWRADSNGCAAGRTRPDAMRRGLLEVIERDHVAHWWYHRVARPAVSPDQVTDRLARRVLAWLAGRGRDCWLLDLTGDLGVPVVAAISVDTTGPRPRPLFGFAARETMGAAIRRALVELAQEQVIVDAADRGLLTQPRADRRWLRTATLDAHPHLVPAESARATPAVPAPTRNVLGWCVDRCVARGLEPLVVELTRREQGVRVVKVVVPGMTPWWPRFAPGRLYDAPVQAGWLPRRRPEHALNPFPIWF